MQIKCTYKGKKYKKICVSQQFLVSLRQIRTIYIMRLGRKTTVLILAVVLGFVIVSYSSVSAILSRYVTREVNKVLATLPDIEASCGSIEVSILQISAKANDLRFSYRGEPAPTDSIAPGAKIRVESIKLDGLYLLRLLRKKAILHELHIVRPTVEIWMDEEHPELSFPTIPKDTTRAPKTFPLKRVALRNLFLEEASLKLHSIHTSLDVATDKCSFEAHDLAFENNAFTFDSIYHVAVASVSILLPDGRTNITTSDIDFVNTGNLTIGATRMQYCSADEQTPKVPGSDIRVQGIEIGPLSHNMMLQPEILIEKASIHQPQVEIWMDDRKPELSFPSGSKKNDKPLQLKLDEAILQHFAINNASLTLRNVKTRLNVSLNDCSLALNDITYDEEKNICFNDSVYSFFMQSASIITPDGLMRIDVNSIEHHDQGPLFVGATHLENTLEKKKLGDYLKEPVTWISMQIDSVSTSPFNPFRKVMAKDWTLDRLNVVVSEMDIFRDARHKPVRPFVMPQEPLMAIPTVFRINRADAVIKKMNIDLSSTDINNGHLTLGDLSATVTNITNRKGQTMHIKGGGPLGTGKAEAAFDMTMDADNTFAISLKATRLNANMLNSFVRPLVGISFDVPVDILETHYKGDRDRAAGTFKMLYHGLEVEVHKEDNVPFKIVTQNANTITHIGNKLLPKSNPKKPGEAPREYNVQAKRNPWKPVALYFFMPTIDGAIKTFLPGLFLSQKIKQPKADKSAKAPKTE